MKQSEFFSSLLPLARKAGEAFRINPVVILAQAAIESGWGQSDLASEHHQLFRPHRLRPLQRLVERRKHRVGRPFPPFPHLRQSRRLVHGLRPPDPFGLPGSPPTSATTRKPSPARSPTANTSAKSTATTVPPIKRCWSRFAEKSVNSFPTP